MRRTCRFFDRRGGLAVWLALLPLTLQAGAYVTDQCTLELTAEPKGAILRSLSGGVSVEILERRDDRLKVRLADRTTGWLKASEVMDNKPVRVLWLEEQARLGDARRQIQTLEAALSQSAKASSASSPTAVGSHPVEPGLDDIGAGSTATAESAESAESFQDALDDATEETTTEDPEMSLWSLLWPAALSGMLGFVGGFSYYHRLVKRRRRSLFELR
ncbi:MAG: hypothetical protein WCP34_13720 [Pseudomonadota bacterium]